MGISLSNKDYIAFTNKSTTTTRSLIVIKRKKNDDNNNNLTERRRKEIRGGSNGKREGENGRKKNAESEGGNEIQRKTRGKGKKTREKIARDGSACNGRVYDAFVVSSEKMRKTREGENVKMQKNPIGGRSAGVPGCTRCVR